VGVGVAVAAVIGLEIATQGLVDRMLSGVAAQAVSWSGMLLTLGLVTGAVAGGISARALNSSLAAAQ
jgi:ABC-type thiamin/hydroxymethylpyrimidine transport system permease subunit